MPEVPKRRASLFLRAESFFTAASDLETLKGGLDPYGGRSLHEQSHGESFLAVLLNRFGPNGFYILDEPEAVAYDDAEPVQLMQSFLAARQRFIDRLLSD